VVSFRSSGGGGFGNPFERAPDLVVADINSGKVSVYSAAELYGVIVRESEDGASGRSLIAIDEAATTATRAGGQ
jgi:N-methylhydantoinase B